MRWMRARFSRFHLKSYSPFSKWNRAQAMAEYALVITLVAIAVYAAYTATGKNVSSLVNKTDTSITAT
jgi:Flp pilus assembly pilin Flp